MSWGRPYKPVHGLARTREYQVWRHMLARCHEPTNPSYPNYGGRGIKVCKRWRAAVTNFLEDMGPRPTPKHWLDRIDNDGDYEPSNCRWATLQQQARNRRSNKVIRFAGRDWVMAELCEHVGLSQSLASVRLRKGWTIERTFTTPSRGRRPNGAGCQRDIERAAQRKGPYRPRPRKSKRSLADEARNSG